MTDRFNTPAKIIPLPPSALWEAIDDGDDEAVAAYLKKHPHSLKIPVMAAGGKFTRGDLAIHIAARGSSIEAVQEIFKAGASVDDRNEATGETPLMAALGSTIDFPKFFIDKGADRDARDLPGRTALHLAASKGYSIAAKMLVAEKFDLEARDKKGNTPLLLALKNSRPEAAQELVSLGANVLAASDDGLTVLDVAANMAAQSAPDSFWAEFYKTLKESAAEAAMKRSIRSSEDAAARLKNGAGSAVAAPAVATFKPKMR